MKGAMLAIVAALIFVAQLLAGCASECTFDVYGSGTMCTIGTISAACCTAYTGYYKSLGSLDFGALTDCSSATDASGIAEGAGTFSSCVTTATLAAAR